MFNTNLTLDSIKHETAKAILVSMSVDGEDKDLWLPKSQMRWTAGTIHIPEWLAKAKGLLH